MLTTLVGLAFADDLLVSSDLGVAAASLEKFGDFFGVNFTGEDFLGVLFLSGSFFGDSFFSDIFVN